MTTEERRQAILNLDYDFLIKSETNEVYKQKVIDLYFDSKKEKKILNSKEEYEYWLKEARFCKINENELKGVFFER